MDFAEKQLAKYGWVKGQGLGKTKSGISQAIKVKLKRDNNGVGCVPGSEFTSHWWEKAFKTAADNIKVKENQEGGVVVETDGKDSSLSLKRRHYNAHRNSLTYGGFLESTSTECRDDGGVVVSSSSSNRAEEGGRGDDVEEEGERGISDDSLFKACGGRTAHKGARHGLKLSGKLARIQQQEEALAVAGDSTGALAVVGENGDSRAECKTEKSKKKSKKRKAKPEEETVEFPETKKLKKQKRTKD